MDLTEITTAISTVGFPIAAFCGIFYLYDKTIKELTATINKIDNTLSSVAQQLERLERD